MSKTKSNKKIINFSKGIPRLYLVVNESSLSIILLSQKVLPELSGYGCGAAPGGPATARGAPTPNKKMH